MGSACPPEWTISSQGAWEQVQGSTTNAYDPDRIMKRHERAGDCYITFVSVNHNKGINGMTKSAFSAESIQEMCSYYRSCLSLKKTAEKYGVTIATIRTHLIKAGVEERGTPRKLTYEQEIKIAEMANDGCSVKEAMDRFQISHPWAIRIAKRHGGSFRNHYHTGVQHANGYVLLYTPHHPQCDAGGYVPEHRLVMEKKIGRFLKKEEVVHHIDRCKANNAPENLMLFESNSAHLRHHGMENKRNFLATQSHDVVSSAAETSRSHG